MHESVLDILSAMDNVLWSPQANQSQILSKSGYQNGFCGIDDLTYSPVQPHHCHQVHGTMILKASEATQVANKTRPEADGIYTLSSNAVAVRTADCLPVLIASSTSQFAMAIHAGWRGLTSGILTHALKVAERFSKPQSLLICIGPALSTSAFEVGRDVVDRLMSIESGTLQAAWSLAVAKGNYDRWHIDLQLAAAIQLHLSGVKSEHIEVIRSCTRTDLRRGIHQDQTSTLYQWHSYRREGKGCGSNWSWIKSP